MAKKLVVEIVGDSKSLDRAFKNSTKSANTFGSSLKSLGKIAAIGVGAAFAGMAVLVKKGFDEIAEGQKVAAQTAATLKSTGGIANVTAKEISDLATEQSRLTGIDDELIQTSENLLLTFKNIRNEVGLNNDIFNQATQAALDLSTAGFGSVESASKMMGKALNDPIKGMTALGRAGVTFTEGQKDTIKSLVETGDLLGAQKIILKEVESQVGGSAKAYGETLPGQLNKLRNSFDDVAAQVAGVFLPALTEGVKAVSGFLGDFAEAKGFKAKLNVVWTNIQDAGKRLVDALRQAVSGVDWQAVWAGASGISAGLQARLEGVDWQAVGDGVITGITTALEGATELAKALADTISTAIGEVPWDNLGRQMGPGFATMLATAFVTLMDPVFWIKNWDLALAIALTVFGGAIGRFVGKAVGASASALAKLGDDLIVLIAGGIAKASPKLGKAFADASVVAFAFLGRAFAAGGKAAAEWISKQFAKLGPLLGTILKVGFIQAGINAVVGLLQGLVDTSRRVDAWIAGLGPRLSAMFSGAGRWLYNAGVAILQGLWDGLMSKWNAVAGWLGGLGGKITSLKGPPAKDAVLLEPVGKLIMQGLQKGMTSGWAPLAKWLETLSPAMTEKVGEAIDAVQAMVLSKKEAFASAFESLVGSALSAFDKLASEAMTKTEKLIAKQDEAMANADRMKALADANAALDAARAAFAGVKPEEGEDPQAFANRLGTATAAIVAAEQARADALFAIQRAKDEKKAAQERKELEEETERKRFAFEKQLGNLKRAYLNQEISTSEFQARLIKLFKKFEVPLGNAAKNMGAAIAAGLNESLASVERAAEAVATAIEKRMNRIKVIITVGVASSDDGRPPGKRAAGGPVRAGMPYIVGEVGPELFVPSQSGQIHTADATSSMAGIGGQVVNLVFNGPTVGTSREFEDTVRRALYDVSRRNPGSGLVLA